MCDAFSSWVMLSGSMPQGSLLGSLTFIVLIDDLTTGCMTHKFVDDTTLFEFINKGEPSTMDLNLTQLLDRFSSNYMNVNIKIKNTKETIISPSNSNVFSPLRVADVEIERVDVFKLLGVYINRSLKWDEHVRSIRNKAASSIHFLNN